MKIWSRVILMWNIGIAKLRKSLSGSQSMTTTVTLMRGSLIMNVINKVMIMIV